MAALEVGRASVNQVVLLHDLAVGATRVSGAPPGVGAPQAAALAGTLSDEAKQLVVSPASSQPGVPALQSALSGYADLAKQLAARPAKDASLLPKGFVAKLEALDATWRPAVTVIGSAGHVQLLAGIAPLLIPQSA